MEKLHQVILNLNYFYINLHKSYDNRVQYLWSTCPKVIRLLIEVEFQCLFGLRSAILILLLFIRLGCWGI